MLSEERKEYVRLRTKRRQGSELSDKESAKFKKLRVKRKKERATKARIEILERGLKEAESVANYKPDKKRGSSKRGDSGDEPSRAVELIDIAALTRQIASSNLSLDVLEDELQDLPTAPNIVAWIREPKFLNYTAFAWQLKVLTELCAEWCTECTDKEWMSQIGPIGQTKFMPVDATFAQFMDKVQLYQWGTCPRCGGKRNRQHGDLPYELAACVGQRAGKSVGVGMLATYVSHRYLMMKNPNRSYGVVPGQPVYMTFTAYTKEQAYETLWDAYSSQYNHGPWFKQYNDYLIQKSLKQGIDSDLMFRNRDTYIWYGNKMLTVSCSAADMKSLRGRTRLFAAIDEIGWFGVGDAVKANGKETREALVKSLRTIRSAADTLVEQEPNTMTAFMVNSSSPSSEFDPIMTLLKTARRDKRILPFHSSTWEASPKITRKSLAGEESANYTEFLRDYGATPPLTDSPFFESDKLVDKCIVSDLRPTVRYKTEYINDAIGGKYIGAKLLDVAPSNLPHIITCDAGESGNSFAVGVYHLEKGDENVSDYLVVDAVIEIAPERNTETNEIARVHFPSIFDMIVQICEKTFVKMVLYDRWQSSGEIQRLRDKKIPAEKYTAVTSDFTTLRNRVYAGGMKIPRMEKNSVTELDLGNPVEVRLSPITHFVLQIKTVRASGHKVLKPIAGEDDMFRTLVLANQYIEDERKTFLTEMSNNPNMRIGLGRTLGVVLRRSLYTGNPGSSGGSSNLGKLGLVKTRSVR